MSTPLPLLSATILRLRETAPGFARRVGGTAAFAALSNEEADLPLPYAFVVPIADSASPRPNAGGAQRITERFAVIVCVDNKPGREDGLGLIAVDALRPLRQEIINSLTPWEPAPGMDSPSYVGSKHLLMTRSRLWHQYDFQVGYYLDADLVEDCNPVKEAYGRLNLNGTPITDWELLDLGPQP